MIETKDFSRRLVVCDRLNLLVNRDNAKPDLKIDMNVGVKWGVYALRKDNGGMKAKVGYILKSILLEGEIEFTVIADFNRQVTPEEVSFKEFHKNLALGTVNYFIQLVADTSSKMGITPIIVSSQVVTDLIKSVK